MYPSAGLLAWMWKPGFTSRVTITSEGFPGSRAGATLVITFTWPTAAVGGPPRSPGFSWLAGCPPAESESVSAFFWAPRTTTPEALSDAGGKQLVSLQAWYETF